MDDIRKGQIALLVLKHMLAKKGMEIGPKARRDLGNMAKEIDVPFDEFLEFSELLAREFIEKTFAKKEEK